MKLEHRGKLILQHLRAFGPKLGYELCSHFKISEQVLLNTMKLFRESGEVAVDKIPRPGERGGPINRFRLAGDEDGKDAQIVIKAAAVDGNAPKIGSFNPSDPFGLASRRTAPNSRAELCMGNFTCSLHSSGKVQMFREGQLFETLDPDEAIVLKRFLGHVDLDEKAQS